MAFPRRRNETGWSCHASVASQAPGRHLPAALEQGRAPGFIYQDFGGLESLAGYDEAYGAPP